MKILKSLGIKKYDPLDNDITSIYIYYYFIVIMVTIIVAFWTALSTSSSNLNTQVTALHTMFYRCFAFLSFYWVTQLLVASAAENLELSKTKALIAYLINALAYFGSLILDVYFNYYFMPTWFVLMIINHLYLSIMQYLSAD